MSDGFQTAFVTPEADLDTRWWWDALGEGRLEVPHCRSCGRTFFPPQPNCPHCGSGDWDRVEASGKGTIYSWVIIHLPFDPAFAGEVPYPILAVELEEGVRLFGRYRGDVDAIRAGLPVRTVIYYVGEQPMLGFEAAK